MISSANVVTLQQVTIDGYRSCRNTDFSLHPNLSALIGINGAGKTNLLSALRLLSFRTRRGFRSETDGNASLSETVITSWFLVNNLRIGYRIRLFLSTTSKNTDEIASAVEEWNFQNITKSKIWREIPDEYLLSKHREFRNIKNINSNSIYINRYIEHIYPDEINFNNRKFFKIETLENTQISNCYFQIKNFCKGITYYGASQFTDPSRCPSSFEIESDGRLTNIFDTSKIHTQFLRDLYTLKTTNINLYEEYERFISKHELGLISRLTWKEVILSSNIAEVKSGGKVKKVRKSKTLIIPKIQIGQSHITFNQLSEGTFKSLAMIFYIMTDASTCLLIEEPEVCVHLGLLNRIVNTIKSYSKYKQVILSTHSDQILDQLEPENVLIVEMTRSGTKATSMEKWVGEKGRVALTNYLEETGTLGEYWRSGGLS